MTSTALLSASDIVSAGGALDFKTRLTSARNAAHRRNPRMLDQDTSLATVNISASNAATSGKYAYPQTVSSPQYFKDALLLEGAAWVAVLYGSVLFGYNSHSVPANGVGVDWTSTFVSGTNANMFRISLLTNSPNVTFQFNSNGFYRPRFLVDGQYINKSGHAPTVTDTSSVAQYATLALPSAKMRMVTIELQHGMGFSRAYIDTGYTAIAPKSNKLRIGILGDSYCVGPDVGTGIAADATYTSMPATPSTSFNGEGMWQHAGDWGGWEAAPYPLGGTGFYGVTGGGSNNYDGRWGDLTSQYTYKPLDALILQGSVNDGYQTSDITGVVKTATKALCNKAFVAFPNIPILLTGVFPAAGSQLSRFQANEAANAAIISEINDKRLAMVPIQTTPAIVPTWTTDNVGNAMISYDNVHFNPVTGHGAAGRWLSDQVYSALMNMVA